MNVLLDAASLGRIGPHTRDDVRGEVRRYYVLALEDASLALIVCRNDLRIEALAGCVVDAALGWDDGAAGYVLHIGRRHSKLTIHRASASNPDTTLAAILQRAPKVRP